MSLKLINNRYLIEETLNSDEFSAVYTAKDVFGDKTKTYIMNEFKSQPVIDAVSAAFYDSGMKNCKSFLESFELDSSLYAVFEFFPGQTLGSLLTNEALKVMDKMSLTDSFLSRMTEISALPPLVRGMLCDIESLTVINKKEIRFNGILNVKAAQLNAESGSFILQIGNILASIYTNSVHPDLEADSDTISPAVYDLIKKCLKGDYTAAAEVYEAFKSTLLYSTFVNEGSRFNVQVSTEASKQNKSTSSIRKTAIVLTITFAFFIGIFYLFYNSPEVKQTSAKAEGTTTNVVHEKKLNTKLIAKFAPNTSKICVGDEVIFVNQSTVSDLSYTLQSYDWTVLDGENHLVAVPAPHAASLTHRFETEGRYTVSLVAKDSNGDYSESYAMYLTVYPKPVIPESSDKSNNDLK